MKQPSEDLKTILVNGACLVYQEQGSGEPVIFVHGSLGNNRSWRSQIGPFAEKYRAISYCRRYHHPNPLPQGETNNLPGLHADDLIRTLVIGEPPILPWLKESTGGRS